MHARTVAPLSESEKATFDERLPQPKGASIGSHIHPFGERREEQGTKQLFEGEGLLK